MFSSFPGCENLFRLEPKTAEIVSRVSHLGFQRPSSSLQPKPDTIADFVTSMRYSGRRTARSLYQAAPCPTDGGADTPLTVAFSPRDKHPSRVRATVPQTGNTLQSRKKGLNTLMPASHAIRSEKFASLETMTLYPWRIANASW
jgi:hypothetical protein